jgi:DNA polymerase-1
MSERRKLVLVDGSSYLYRAFHALPPLTSSRGEPTGAVLGVLNMLLKLLKEESPDLIAIVFDAPGRTFRDALFDEYKAQRTPMPDDLRSQLQPLLDSVEALGLPLLRVAGVEADDVIGTLATRAAADGLEVLISTGDKDMSQLVNDKITLVNTMTSSRLDRDGVKAKFDVWPEQIIDYLALVGDTSDNIPGVAKVGPKTAAKWLQEYTTLDSLLTNADKIGGKVGESLRASFAAIELSRKLATLDCNVTLAEAPESLTRRDPDTEKLRAIYTRYELRSLLRSLSGEASGDTAATPSYTPQGAVDVPPAPRPEQRYATIATPDALRALVAQLKSAHAFAFDATTDTSNRMRAELIGLAFAIDPGVASYVPFGHNYPGAPDQLTREQVLAEVKPLLEDERRAKVGFDLKYAAHVLERFGVHLAGMRFDAMLESYVWNSTAVKHELGAVTRKYLGFETRVYETLTGKGAKQLGFNQVAVDLATPYACEIADVSLQLHQHLAARLASVANVQGVYDTIEQPLLPALVRMEQAGVLIDASLLRTQSSELATKVREIETEAFKVAGAPFSLESPKQLQEILFGKLGLPVLGKTPTGQPSTAEAVLEELAEQYELPRLIMQHRAFTKLKSTYTDKLPHEIIPATGRVHTSYQQAVAATGRLSSTDPNLQNIPIRTPEGRRIRQAFIAPEGWRIVAADYSQIELRIMAHLSGDASLLKAFSEDRDIHQTTAAEVFNTPIAQVSANQRRAAKAVNFGLIYGMSAFGLARQLGIERREAQKYVDLYFERFPGVRRYMEQTRQQAREAGFVETVFGRRLYLNDIQSRNAALRQGAERAAINAPMQGTAADIIKRAMIDVDRWLIESKLAVRLIMQVHDELVFEVRADLVEELTARVRELMARAAQLSIPLKVDVGVGANWDEAH